MSKANLQRHDCDDIPAARANMAVSMTRRDVKVHRDIVLWVPAHITFWKREQPRLLTQHTIHDIFPCFAGIVFDKVAPVVKNWGKHRMSANNSSIVDAIHEFVVAIPLVDNCGRVAR